MMELYSKAMKLVALTKACPRIRMARLMNRECTYLLKPTYPLLVTQHHTSITSHNGQGIGKGQGDMAIKHHPRVSRHSDSATPSGGENLF
jgi:hypothetical protein